MSFPSWLFRAHRLSRLPRLTQLPLGVEITLLLVIKITLLTVLAKTCFADPQAKHMRMPTAQVEQHLLASSVPAPAFSASPSTVAGDAPAASAPSVSSVPPITFPTTTEVTHASH